MGEFNHLMLAQKQTQQLNIVMTPALRQAIELLQYSTIDLYDYIKNEVLENPLIELEEQEGNPFQYEKRAMNTRPSQVPDHMNWIADNHHNKRDELIQQAKLQFQDDQMIQLVTWCIQNLDDSGYLVVPQKHPLSEDTITLGIDLLQQIGPPGLGARNIQECLALQLQHLSCNDCQHEQALVLIREHFSLFTKRKWLAIAKQMNLSLEEVKQLYLLIQQLGPKPMIDLNPTETEYMIPDIIIEEHNNQLSYHLHDQYLPTIRYNQVYTEMGHSNDHMRQYISEKMTRLQWLQNSIAKRRETISKIIEYVLHTQSAFFKTGLSALQPLTLQEVAEAIQMHESTISRATANKIIQTPVGIFDFKALFTSKMETVEGASISQQKVKALLAQFIANENKQKPLSDQKIALYLTEKEGIVVSRRTISKYREELHIPSSRMRKEI